MPSDTSPAMPEHLILFDGVCAVCNGGMRWLLDHDTRQVLHYAPLQGDVAAEVLARHPEVLTGLDTIVYVQQLPTGERVSVHSRALLDIARVLPAPWHLATSLWLIPAIVRDPMYRLFAAWRYRVFGTVDYCRIPRASEMTRFLA